MANCVDLPDDLKELLEEDAKVIDVNATLTDQRAIKKASKASKAQKSADRACAVQLSLIVTASSTSVEIDTHLK